MKEGDVVYFKERVKISGSLDGMCTKYKHIWHKGIFVLWGVDTDTNMGSYTVAIVEYQDSFQSVHPTYLKTQLGKNDEFVD